MIEVFSQIKLDLFATLDPIKRFLNLFYIIEGMSDQHDNISPFLQLERLKFISTATR